MSDVITLLTRFEKYLEDQDAFYAIFELIPSPYKYQIILSLLNIEKQLEPGNIRKGTPRKGCIKLENNKLICTDKHDNKHILCELPKNPRVILM